MKKINVHKQFSMFVKQKNYNIEEILTNLLLYSSCCNEKKKYCSSTNISKTTKGQKFECVINKLLWASFF